GGAPAGSAGLARPRRQRHLAGRLSQGWRRQPEGDLVLARRSQPHRRRNAGAGTRTGAVRRGRAQRDRMTRTEAAREAEDEKDDEEKEDQEEDREEKEARSLMPARCLTRSPSGKGR